MTTECGPQATCPPGSSTVFAPSAWKVRPTSSASRHAGHQLDSRTERRGVHRLSFVVDYGGTAITNNEARNQSWDATVHFLDRELR